MCSSLDRRSGDDRTPAAVNVEGNAHAPQLLNLAPLATETSQQRKFVGTKKHRDGPIVGTSKESTRPLLKFDERYAIDPDTPR